MNMNVMCRYPGIKVAVSSRQTLQPEIVETVSAHLLKAGVAAETVEEYKRSVAKLGILETLEVSKGWVKLIIHTPVHRQHELIVVDDIGILLSRMMLENDEEYDIQVKRATPWDHHVTVKIVLRKDPRLTLFAPQHDADGDLPALVGTGPTLASALNRLNNVCVLPEGEEE
jgi:hypothetical protein